MTMSSLLMADSYSDSQEILRFYGTQVPLPWSKKASNLSLPRGSLIQSML